MLRPDGNVLPLESLVDQHIGTCPRYMLFCTIIGANEVRAHARLRARADIVAIKLGIIGANVVRAHARFPCEGRRSGH